MQAKSAMADRDTDGKTATMTPEEFIRRLLTHVLPKGYVKIRHYGLVASSNVKTKLEAARDAISGDHVEATPAAPAVAADWRAAMRELTGIDLMRCRVCGGEHLGRWRFLGFGMKQEPSSRGPPTIGSPP